MTQSPRLQKTDDQLPQRPQSASMVLIATALDTTWRAFVPTIGGTFLGIGIDHLFSITPVGTIVCLIVGAALSALLIAQQIRSVRKSR